MFLCQPAPHTSTLLRSGFDNWHDGFPAALRVLNGTGARDVLYPPSDATATGGGGAGAGPGTWTGTGAPHMLFDIDTFGLPDVYWQPSQAFLADLETSYDLVLVKSNWDWHVDRWARRWLSNVHVGIVLAIAGVTAPPSRDAMLFYDALLYETEWYRPQLEEHPIIQRAFGVNTAVMKLNPFDSLDTARNEDGTPSIDPDARLWDVIFVGGLCELKRPLRLLDKAEQGLSVLAVGTPACPPIVEALRRGGVTVLPRQLPYSELAALYRLSRSAYIPAPIHGGGERAVLEARACGLEVEVEADNPKLRELVEGPVFDEYDYARGIAEGLSRAFEAWKLSHRQMRNREDVVFTRLGALSGPVPANMDD